MPTISRRIKELAKDHKQISFVARTGDGELQTVILKSPSVRKTAEGNMIVTGRSVLREIEHDQRTGRRARRKPEDFQIRSFRIDRIIPNTTMANV